MKSFKKSNSNVMQKQPLITAALYPADLSEQMEAYCSPADELGVRMFRMRLEGTELIFQGFLTYEQHIAALVQTHLNVHRERAMMLAFSGEIRARIASPEMVLAQVRGVHRDDLLGTIKVGATGIEWTSWLSHRGQRPVDERLSFSAVRYRRGDGAYPW